MATTNYTTSTTGNDAAYVSENQLADAVMFIQAAMRLVDMKDAEAFILLGKAVDEIVAAQDYLESMDPVESPIDGDVAAMLSRIGLGR
jgi:hypothetical protein